MTLLNRILVVAAFLPLIFATENNHSSGNSKSCSSSEFYFQQKDCCLPNGGQSNPPQPPAGTQCPTSGWNWHDEKSCCVPHQPNPAPPSCSSGWSWNGDDLKCSPSPAPSTTPPPSHTTAPPPSHTTAPPSKPTQPPSSDDDCDDNQFFFPAKSCCLPQGGQPNPPSPPSGSNCPQSGWSWSNDHACCVPHQAPPAQGPPPQCPFGWLWNVGDLKCHNQPPSTSTPPPSHPSGKPGSGHYKRQHRSRASTVCPRDLEACPIAGRDGLTGDYECLQTASELESCGGCASTGAGQNCNAIEGAWNVACEQRQCKVYTCAQGYKVSQNGKACQKL